MAEPIYIPEGSRTAGAASAATPKTSPGWWQRYLENRRRYQARPGYKPMRPPGWGTAKFLTKAPLGAAKWLGTGMTGAVGGALMPTPMFPWERPIATTEQEFAPTGLEGLPISHMEETFSPRAGEYTPSYQPYTRPATYGADTSLPGYDEQFLSDLIASRGEEQFKERVAGEEDSRFTDVLRLAGGKIEQSIKDWALGEAGIEAPVEPPAVYNLNKRGKEEDTDKPLTTGSTSINEAPMKIVNKSSFNKILDLIGAQRGGIDWEDVEKTYSGLAGWGILSDQGTTAANSFLSGTIDLARMRNDQTWRAIQLMSQPKITYYPIVNENGAIRLHPDKDILNLHPVDDVPAGYSRDKPAESPTSTKLIEIRETKRLLQTEGLASAWAFNLRLADAPMTGSGKDFLSIGAEIAADYVALHPEMRKIKVMPYTTEIDDMLEALKGRSPQEAIAAGDLEKENWDYWVATFGNWIPDPSMLR